MNIRNYEYPKDFKGIADVLKSLRQQDYFPHFEHPEEINNEDINKEFSTVKYYNHPLFLVAEKDNIIEGLVVGHDLMSFIFKISDPELKLNKKFLDLSMELGITNESEALKKFYYKREIITKEGLYDNNLGLKLFESLEEHALKNYYSLVITRTAPRNRLGINFIRNQLGFREIFSQESPERIYFYKKLESEND